MNSLFKTGFSVGVAWKRAAEEANVRTEGARRLCVRAARATRDCIAGAGVVVVDGRESGNDEDLS